MVVEPRRCNLPLIYNSAFIRLPPILGYSWTVLQFQGVSGIYFTWFLFPLFLCCVGNSMDRYFRWLDGRYSGLKNYAKQLNHLCSQIRWQWNIQYFQCPLQMLRWKILSWNANNEEVWLNAHFFIILEYMHHKHQLVWQFFFKFSIKNGDLLLCNLMIWSTSCQRHI